MGGYAGCRLRSHANVDEGVGPWLLYLYGTGSGTVLVRCQVKSYS